MLRGVLLCAAGVALLQALTPFWWWILAVPFAYGALARRSAWDAVRSGMLGAGVVWLAAAGVQAATTAELIARRVGGLVGAPSAWAMVGLATLVAVLCGALGGGAGWSMRGLRTGVHRRA